LGYVREDIRVVTGDPKGLPATMNACKRRSKNPSLKRPVGPVAPE
jgi:hypothetical protein